MNRENKRKSFEKGYYKTHACSEVFTCKNCGRVVVPEGAGSTHRNHCPNCLCSLHVDEEPGDRASACGGLMGTRGSLGTQRRRMGHRPPLPTVRQDGFQPHRCRR